MSLPVCPRCDSRNVIPSPHNAGQNNCLTCGLYAQVAEFHKIPDVARIQFPNVKPLAYIQRGNQTHRRRGQPKVVYGKTQRPATQQGTFWWEKD